MMDSSNSNPVRALTILTFIAVVVGGCSARATRAPRATRAAPPAIRLTEWRATPPLGYAAEATRRNLRPGDQLQFRDLIVLVVGTEMEPQVPRVRLRLTRGGAREERVMPAGRAFNWEGYHIAVVAMPRPGELGGGLVAVEVATVASLPAAVAASDSAGGAALRLRVPHRITHVTLHHTGSAEPLRPQDNPVEKLRGLQTWGARDRNWWDVPYHFLLDLDGRIYAGRDWQYMGETNTTYDPAGHFLISVIGNYEQQQPTRAQLEAIGDLMAWAIARFDVPIERIGGHYDYAETTCPGQYLRPYLEDGTFRRMVLQRLDRAQ
jgi:hypothetical protein